MTYPIPRAQLNEQVVPRDPGIGDEDIKLGPSPLALGHQGLDFLFSACYRAANEQVHPIHQQGRSSASWSRS